MATSEAVVLREAPASQRARNLIMKKGFSISLWKKRVLGLIFGGVELRRQDSIQFRVKPRRHEDPCPWVQSDEALAAGRRGAPKIKKVCERIGGTYFRW